MLMEVQALFSIALQFYNFYNVLAFPIVLIFSISFNIQFAIAYSWLFSMMRMRGE